MGTPTGQHWPAEGAVFWGVLCTTVQGDGTFCHLSGILFIRAALGCVHIANAKSVCLTFARELFGLMKAGFVCLESSYAPFLDNVMPQN